MSDISGNITDETVFVSSSSEVEEQSWCDCISKGRLVKPTWGSDRYVPDWANGRKHDPNLPENKRIRNLIRDFGEKGISRRKIVEYIGRKREGVEDTVDLLRELDKQGHYTRK